MKSKSHIDVPSLRELLDAGAHFGHRKEWSKPAAKKFTFVVRDGVCVINLEETQARLADASRYLEDIASQGKIILLVGTKRQARAALEAAAQKTGMPFVAQRWLGGTLTNFAVLRNNIKRMADMEQTLANEKEAAKLTKRERKVMSDLAKKLHISLDGIASMTRQPDLLLVVDPNEEETAVREAHRMGVPIMAICDTDSDPNDVDYPIPANDNAPKTNELLLNFLADAIVRGTVKAKPTQ